MTEEDNKKKEKPMTFASKNSLCPVDYQVLTKAFRAEPAGDSIG